MEEFLQQNKMNIASGEEQRQLDYNHVLEKLQDYIGNFEVIKVANITNICYGRDVGYKIEEIVLPKEIQEISATDIRNKLKKHNI
jgi:hypothetical protein